MKKRIVMTADKNMNWLGSYFPIDIIKMGTILIVDYDDDNVASISYGNSSTREFQPSDYEVWENERGKFLVLYDPMNGECLPDGKVMDFVNSCTDKDIIYTSSELVIDALRALIKQSTKYVGMTVYVPCRSNGIELMSYTVNAEGRYVDGFPYSVHDRVLEDLL